MCYELELGLWKQTGADSPTQYSEGALRVEQEI